MNMKKIVLILFGIILLFFGKLYAQNATINGISGNSHQYVCSGSMIFLESDITSGNVDSVQWLVRVAVGGPFGSWSFVSDSSDISAPDGGAVLGNLYRYKLTVYQSGLQYVATVDLHVNSLPTANIIVQSGTNVICAGQDVTFSASAGGTNYDFRINGISAQSDTSSQFSINSLNNNDTITVVVTDSVGCSATSSPTIMTVHDLPDVGSITPSITCNGEDMDFTYENLTGSGPWTVSFWDPTHTIQYGLDYNVSNPNGSINDVSIPYGTSEVHFKIQDNNTGCSNF